jgi:hypothetical protein
MVYRFFWAWWTAFPTELLPDETGLTSSLDAYDGEVAHGPRGTSWQRRGARLCMQKFARTAAMRLGKSFRDPTAMTTDRVLAP